jgi:hypothetical protein
MTTIFAEVRIFDGDRLLDGSYDVVLDGPVIAAVEPPPRAGGGVRRWSTTAAPCCCRG